MAIWLDHRSKVMVQGMTGSEGMKHTQRMLRSGTAIVGGVNPRKAGTDVEYVLVEGAGHGDLPWFQKPVIERVVKFFEKRLGSPAKDAAEGNNL